MDRGKKIAAGLIFALAFACAPARADDLIAKRPYRLYEPKGLDPQKPAPLLLLLHCFGCSSGMIARLFDIEKLADEKGFLVALPDGKIDAGDRRFWNATENCCDLQGRGVDDVAYLTAVIDDVAKKRKVDPKRVFAMGYSNGGFMSHRLACDRASRFAAIVSVAGASWRDRARCKPTEPVAILEVHGTADKLVPYEGGAIPGVNVPPLPSVHETIEAWAERDGCAKKVEKGEAVDVDVTQAGAESSVERFPGCKANTAVELWTVPGGQHRPTLAPGFAARAWEFLASHPKP